MTERFPSATATALAIAGLILAACNLGRLAGPSREEVLAQLQQEADTMKKGGEQMNPALRIKVTWTVEGIDLQEQPNDDAHPWKGIVRFKILSTMHDADGSETNDLIRKHFTYVYDKAGKKWLFQSSTTPPK